MSASYPVKRTMLAGSQKSASHLSFPSDIQTHGLLMVFNEYKYESTRGMLDSKSVNVAVGDSILLPIPASISDTFNVNIRNYDRNYLGDAIAIGANKAGGVGGEAAVREITNQISQILPDQSKIIDGLKTGGLGGLMDAFSKSANYIGRNMLDKAGATRAYDLGTGSTLNPKVALTFDGINLKRHSFEWTLTPRDEQESALIRAIGNTIKKNSLPAYQSVNFNATTLVKQAMLRYPSTVNMYFIGVDQSYFYFFKTAMVEQITLNYAPQGVSILKGGRPAAVNLSIQLTETDIHTAGDYGGVTDDPYGADAFTSRGVDIGASLTEEEPTSK